MFGKCHDLEFSGKSRISGLEGSDGHCRVLVPCLLRLRWTASLMLLVMRRTGWARTKIKIYAWD